MSDPHAPPVLRPAQTLAVGRWRVLEFTELSSTHDVAAALPPWHAVRAGRQHAGRGRFQRTWISDEGGLWISAVVPFSTRIRGWEALPLVVGWVVIAMIRDFGVTDIRMRWPNDIMVTDCKLAGLLVERPQPDRASVGLGLNVLNRPDHHDVALRTQATRLADHVSPPPSLHEVTAQFLHRLEGAVQEWLDGGFAPFADRVNTLWRKPSPVRLELDGQDVSGDFEGVTSDGSLRLRDDTGTVSSFQATQVKQLVELTIPS